MLEVCSTPGFSVTEVTGLVAGQEVDRARLRTALAESGVLCLRFAKRLTKDEFAWVAGLFGDIKDPVAETKDGAAFRYSPALQHIDAGYVLTDEMCEAKGVPAYGGLDDQRPGLFETWHSDDTFTERPALATVLHARALPPSGGGPTHFIDMRSAYRKLPSELQQRVSSLSVVYGYNNEDAFSPRRAASGPADALRDVEHPLVRKHPYADSLALFIDLDRAKHVADMDVLKGRALLRECQQFAEDNAARCEHVWRDCDALVWDNATVQHKAQGNFKLGEPRRFWRHMVEGPRPQGAAL
jgi:alpha-ketoglutarate-dependent taurine dioxygenase